ncbi:MAG: hypothetical protein F6K36_08845 [Symploca sp. SIO3C6]|nr:hypothetical protein [Symploca sp. SIO3C6]
MGTQFKGVFLRDTLQDKGIEPSVGSIYCSPDIILSKTESQDPANDFGDWNSNYNSALEFGQDNYVYVRCQNTASEQRTGTVHVYWCPVSLSLHPSEWLQNKLKTRAGDDSVTFTSMNPKEKRVADVPFIITPPKNTHVCLVAIATDEEHSRGLLPDTTNVADWVNWVRNHANAAWKNLAVVNTQPDKSYHFVTNITNPDQESLDFQIKTSLQNALVGTTIENEVELAGQSVHHQEVTNPDDSTLDYRIMIPPGNYELDVNITSPENQNLPSDLVIDITASVPGHGEISGVKVQLTDA